MGFGTFDRPIGAHADVSELEYVSALMQTTVEEMRTDGSITATDIALFLTSRYGMNITPQEVSEQILADFCCGKNTTHNETAYIDLMEFVSILFISKLRRSENEHKCDFMFQHVLKMLQSDGIGLDDNDENRMMILTPSVLKRIFERLGEFEMSGDAKLLRKMCAVVANFTKNEVGKPVLTAETLQQALTYDIKAFASTDEILTNFADAVRKTEWDGGGVIQELLQKRNVDTDDEEEEEQRNTSKSEYQETHASTKKLPLLKTAPFLDWTADTFRSKLLVILLWASFGMSVFTYGIVSFPFSQPCNGFENGESWVGNAGAFACSIGWSTARWYFTLLLMSAYGLVFFLFAGRGNGIETKKYRVPLQGTVAALLFTFVPLAFPNMGHWFFTFLAVTTMVTGCLVFLLQLWNTISVASPAWCGGKYKSWLVPGTIRGESMVRQSGRKKIDNMVENALDMHRNEEGDDDTLAAVQSYLGRALFTYSSRPKETEKVGGFWWTWSRIWNNKLFMDEGLWFSGRLVSINATQFLVSLVILAAGGTAAYLASVNFETQLERFEKIFYDLLDEFTPNNLADIFGVVSEIASDIFLDGASIDECGCPNVEDCGMSNLEGCQAIGDGQLCSIACYSENAVDPDYLVQEALLQRAGFATEGIRRVFLAALSAAARETAESLYPSEKHMVMVPVFFGAIAAFVVALAVSLVTIPSAASTMLKLRCGVIPLMHDPKHAALRTAPDQTVVLRGAMFWGTLLSAGLMALIVFGLAFFLLWQVSAFLAQQVVAFVVGLLLVVFSHWLLVRSCRKATSMAFYRTRVRAYNVIVHARECAVFSLSVGFTLVRMAKLIFTSILFVGRLDRPYLADGVGEIEEIGFKLDNHPHIFLMELLQHEAHRHPYIDMFGAVCLLKLRTGDGFVNRAGSGWRLLLLLMLMPWLTRYRRLAQTGGEIDARTVLDLSFAPVSFFDISVYRRAHPNDDEEDDDDDDADKVSAIEHLEEENRMLKEQLAILEQLKKTPTAAIASVRDVPSHLRMPSPAQPATVTARVWNNPSHLQSTSRSPIRHSPKERKQRGRDPSVLEP